MWFAPPQNSSWIEPLPDGHQGTMRTLETMRYLCRKDYQSSFIRAYVWRLIRAPGHDPVPTLFFYARDRILYVEDPPQVEKVADFQRTTELGYGDCDDKVVWLATALLSIDVSVRFVVQSYGETWDHVYLEFYDWARLGWVALDPTADGHTGVVGDVGWSQPLPAGGYEMRFDV
jgi:hypothetical protein